MNHHQREEHRWFESQDKLTWKRGGGLSSKGLSSSSGMEGMSISIHLSGYFQSTHLQNRVYILILKNNFDIEVFQLYVREYQPYQVAQTYQFTGNLSVESTKRWTIFAKWFEKYKVDIYRLPHGRLRRGETFP